MNVEIKNGYVDFSKLPGKDLRKIKRYYAQQQRKHRNKSIAEIKQKVAERFNIHFKTDSE